LLAFFHGPVKVRQRLAALGAEGAAVILYLRNSVKAEHAEIIPQFTPSDQRPNLFPEPQTYEMPFLFWVKDEEGRYLWGNRTISQLAKENVIGKTDSELMWGDNAEALRTNDKNALETGKPVFTHEYVDKSGHGKATLNVCKFMGDLDRKKHVFGISFIID